MSQETSTSEAQTQASHLDSTTIDELKELLGTAKFKYLVEVFCENSGKNIEILHQNKQEVDFDEIYSAAHSMAGSSANMGALVLAELCRQLVQQAKDKNNEHLQMVIEGILAEQQQVVVELVKLTE